jgi:hypothetical protein
VSRRALLLLAAALAATAVILAVSGGFRTTVGGLRVSARSPAGPGIAALLAGAIWFALARRDQGSANDLADAWRAIERHAPHTITGIAIVVAAVTAAFATHSAAGADASGYLSQAALWTSGHLFHADPLAGLVSGHDPWLTTPLGWRPAGDGSVQAPTYPPGLPLLMALPHALGGTVAASVVVIVSAAIALLATGAVATELAGGIAGIAAAVLLGISPVFLYQSIQPMSDVPVTAAWMACFYFVLRKRDAGPSGPASLSSGIACAIAVLIRPNLAPLAIVPLAIAGNRFSFAAPVAIAGLSLAGLQWIWYGSPLRSGYGTAGELFSLSNAGVNAARYFSWLMATAPMLLLGIAGFVLVRTQRPAQALATFAALVIAAYLVYAPFDQWSYLRFLLPALAVLAIFTGVALARGIERAPIVVRAPLFVALVLGAAAHGIWVARSHDTFKLAGQLRRVAQVGDFINRNLPESALIVAGEQSGAMRYYTGRPILRWEAATPKAVIDVLVALQRTNRPIYFVLDAWEHEPFRAKFAGVPAAVLDWPPVVDAGTSHRTRLWSLADRGRFLKGVNVSTIRLP